VDELRGDIVFALRLATRTPLFTLLAVLTLALGAGANAAVFSVIKSVLLDPLPYADGDRLVRVYGRPLESTVERSALSSGAVADLSARQKSFERMAAFYPATWEVIYRPANGPRVRTAGGFAPGFLETLGVRPTRGRGFVNGETPGAGVYVALLSHDMWQGEFAGDPAVIGSSIRVDADTWQIVGILPRGFTGPMGSADLWFPIDLESSLSDPARSRRTEWLGLVGRLKPGATIDGARSDLSGIASAMAREHPDTDASRAVTVMSLRNSLAGDTRTPLLVLMVSAVLVLTLACANLAGALLSRTITRRTEFAVRAALGAGRRRLVRQLLTESLMLTIAGSFVGLLLAGLGLAVLQRIDAPTLPLYADLTIDSGAILLSALVAVCTGIAIGIVPAMTVYGNTQRTLRESDRSSSDGLRSGRLRGALLSAQIALSLSLLVGAGLLARSLIAMTRQPLGFDPDHVLTVSVKGPVPETDAVRKQFFDALEDQVRALPGVIAVANTSELPGPAMRRSVLAIQGNAGSAEGSPPDIPFVTVSDDWFAAMRIPLLRGRGFGPQDRMDTTPVIVVSEAMARAFWPGGNPIGARIRLGSDVSAPWSEVIGIAGDVRTDPTLVTPEPLAYGAARQALMRESRIFTVRAEGDALAVAGPFRAVLMGLDPSVPMKETGTLDAMLDAGVNPRRLPALLMTAFAILALTLAATGIYALFANLAAAREREFGVRMALGSSPGDIARLILRYGAVWTAAGLAGGAIGIGVIGYAVRNLLYRVSPIDPITIGCAVAALASAAALAMMIPIRRAIRLDARTVLR
jgi:putative ABC transport system permease protein